MILGMFMDESLLTSVQSAWSVLAASKTSVMVSHHQRRSADEIPVRCTLAGHRHAATYGQACTCDFIPEIRAIRGQKHNRIFTIDSADNADESQRLPIE